jgi:hypothetical protein
MLVEVVVLRRKGAKIPREALGEPRRGWLRLDSANIAGVQSLHAALHASRSRGAPPVIQGLSHARVRKIDERGMLIYGLEAEGHGGPGAQRWPQAWWCRPLPAVASRTDCQ